jgi:2-dehydropantoate 2-reductase
LADDYCVVLFQNGWGNTQEFTHFFDEESVYNARVITGFARSEGNRVEVTVHAEAIHIGNLHTEDTDRIVPLCEAIAAGDIPCEAYPQIERDLWAKLLFNCPLNSLGAIFSVPYGALGVSAQSKRVMEMIIREIYCVMEAARYCTHWSSPEEYLEVFYGTLIPLTAEHFSSTLQDLRAGKPTEIDALNGAIVEMGRTHSIPVPANEVVYRMIKYLEDRPKP